MRVVAERSVIQNAASFVSFDVPVIRKDDGQGRHNGGNVLTVKPGRKASGGVIGSENVDMSSDKQGERPCRRKSKGSCLKLI